MLPERQRRLRQIKAVEREYLILRSALDRLLAERGGRAAGARGMAWRPGDLRHAANHLEGTYTIRLFAEFETGLRRFWQAKRRADPPARTRDLMEGVAAMRRIPPAHCQDAHEVRDYRNSLIHEREDPVPEVPIAEARRRLCRFLSRLPLNW